MPTVLCNPLKSFKICMRWLSPFTIKFTNFEYSLWSWSLESEPLPSTVRDWVKQERWVGEPKLREGRIWEGRTQLLLSSPRLYSWEGQAIGIWFRNLNVPIVVDERQQPLVRFFAPHSKIFSLNHPWRRRKNTKQVLYICLDWLFLVVAPWFYDFWDNIRDINKKGEL